MQAVVECSGFALELVELLNPKWCRTTQYSVIQGYLCRCSTAVSKFVTEGSRLDFAFSMAESASC